MYRLDLYWNDVYISRFDTQTSTAQEVYDYCSNEILVDGMRNNMTLKDQKQYLIDFCNDVWIKKKHKKKIPSEIHCMFLTAFFALHKLNYKPTYDSYIHLRHKKQFNPKRKIHPLTS